MARQNINNTPVDSGLGDTLFEAMNKINAMTLELYAADSSFGDDIDLINATLDTLNDGTSILDHKHTIAQINGLQAALNAKVSSSTYVNDMMAVNASIQAINDSLSDIIVILNSKVEEAPFSGITYGRKDGAWVQITGGTGPSDDYVPYTGATKNVNLGNNEFATESNITARNFIINSTPYGEMLIGDNSIYQRIAFNSNDTSNNFGNIELLYNPEEGFVSTKTEISGNYTQINQSNNTILFKNYDINTDILNTINFNSDSSNFNKIINSLEGFKVSPFNGNVDNIFELGTYYGSNENFRQINFRNYGDGIEFPTNKSIVLNANIEEGFALTISDNIYSTQISSSYGSIFLQNTDGTNTNTIQVNPISTDFSKRLITQEGFEGQYVKFATANTETTEVGKMYWNDTDGTVNLGLKGGNVTLQIGQEQLVRVVNKTATNITLQESAYQAVRVTGAQGQRLKVDLALATNDLNSAETIGLVTETILNNQEGFVTTSGLVNKINTTGSLQGETWNDGDVLYLSPTVAGAITNIKPSAPNHLVIIGYVVYAHAVNGKIFVKVDNGYELDELHNVAISAATNNQVLTYESSTGLWKNKDVANSIADLDYLLMSSFRSLYNY